ncbi:MAG: NAD(P)-dependent oxidoreductase [Desulfobacterales bacterium]
MSDLKSIEERFERMPPGLDFGRAVVEADRCLLCHDAPCSQACPADTRPAEFIRKLRFKNITGAIRTIKRNNILGGACGVLCPTAQLCEQACSARMVSEARPEGAERPIRIGALQRFLVEHGRRIGFNPLSAGPPAHKAKVAVVGSGPAGLSCAAQLAQAGYPVTVFEARPEPGGVLRYGVVAYRFDPRFLEAELADVRALGVEFKCNHPIDGHAGAEALLDQGYDAVFLGPGLWAAHSLNPSGQSIQGVFSSVDYLAALREGRFDELVTQFQGKTAAVIGGGSVAMDCVESAVRLDAADVYLIYRRSYSQMPAEEEERIEALQAGVHYLLLHQPLEYLSDANQRLKAIRLARTQLGAPDDSGRRRPQVLAGSEWEMPVDVVIEAIGNRAPDDSPAWYPHVKVDDRNRIVTDPQTGATSLPGIFAGGDIVRGPALVVQAVQDGKTAARAMDRYLQRQSGK